MLEMTRHLLLLYQNFLIPDFHHHFSIMKLKSALFPDRAFTDVPWMNTPTYKYLHIHTAGGGRKVASASLYHIHSCHWHVQNATIPRCSQELLSFLLYTFSCHLSLPTILPSSLTSSCHLFLGLPINLVVSKFTYKACPSESGTDKFMQRFI
jgi:hypothetical protein